MSDFTLHSFNKITKDSWKQEVGNTNFQNGLIIVIKYRLIYLSSGHEKILNKEKFPSLKNCVENEEMIFCYQNCSDLLWEKNCSSDRKKTFKIRGWRPRIFNNLEITRTIYSNSERSEQFLVTECFFNLFQEVSHI